MKYHNISKLVQSLFFTPMTLSTLVIMLNTSGHFEVVEEEMTGRRDAQLREKKDKEDSKKDDHNLE